MHKVTRCFACSRTAASYAVRAIATSGLVLDSCSRRFGSMLAAQPTKVRFDETPASFSAAHDSGIC